MFFFLKKKVIEIAATANVNRQRSPYVNQLRIEAFIDSSKCSLTTTTSVETTTNLFSTSRKTDTNQNNGSPITTTSTSINQDVSTKSTPTTNDQNTISSPTSIDGAFTLQMKTDNNKSDQQVSTDNEGISLGVIVAIVGSALFCICFVVAVLLFLNIRKNNDNNYTDNTSYNNNNDSIYEVKTPAPVYGEVPASPNRNENYSWSSLPVAQSDDDVTSYANDDAAIHTYFPVDAVNDPQNVPLDHCK